MEYGKIIKKLRKERGISQRQLSDGIVARVTLTDFENKNTNISFQTLLLYLNRMNIRIDEFFLLHASDEVQYVEKRKASEYFAQCTQNGISEVLKGIAYFQRKYQETEDTFYYFLVINLRIFLLSENVLTIDDLTDEINFLMKYFEKVETWGRFEIIMLINCMPVFSGDFLFIQHHKVVLKLKSLSVDSMFQRDISAYTNNLCLISYKKGYGKLLESGMILLKEIGDKDERNIYERLVYQFFYEATQENKNLKKLKNILVTMQSLGMDKLSEGYSAIYQKISECHLGG